MSRKTPDAAAALESLVTREAPRLLQYFARRVDDIQDAADLVSETLLVAWRRHAAIPADPDEARMWLYGVGRRVLNTHWRSRRRRDALTNRLRGDLQATARWAHDGGDFDEVRAAIAALKPVDRELIVLTYWDGFTSAEAASLLNLKPATARSRLARARTVLKEHITATTETAVSVAPDH